MTSRFLALLAALVLALAQSGAQAQPADSFSQQELDQMLAPIALYPDALLSQLLMAATYPLEVVEAARWARARPGLSGDAAVRAAESENWDPSVKSLLALPQVLARMDENLQWTQALGDAFLEQRSEVMDTVQALRRRAQAAGNLRSDDRVSVVESGPSLLLRPLDLQVVYVPYYDPQLVYGSWWWPAYPPARLLPWPDSYARPAYAGGLYWGSPVGISVGFFFGAFDWPRRQLRVVQFNNDYYHGASVNRALIAKPARGAWRHEPVHRRGIAYRGIEARQRFDAARAPQGLGNRARPAEPRHLDGRMHAPPVARPETRAQARPIGHRPDARPAAATRAQTQTTPPARPAPLMQPAAAITRFDHRRETRGLMQVAPPAPVKQPAAVLPRAATARPLPVARPIPAALAAPPSRGNRQAPEPGARHETRQAREPATQGHPAQAARRRNIDAEPMGRRSANR